MFLFPAERIHHLIVGGIKLSRYIPFLPAIMRLLFRKKSYKLEREVFGLKFSNPIGMAAGFDKNCEVYNDLYNLGFGFVEVGTIPPRPQGGNPKPRVFRAISDKAIINRMGIPSKGKKYAVEMLKKGKRRNLIVAGNIGKNSDTPNEMAAEDYLASFRALYDYVDFFVVNISCPNVKDLTKLQNSDSQNAILEALVNFRRGQDKYRPICVKISPDLTYEQIDGTIEVIKKCNVDGIVATNTTTSRDGLTLNDAKIEAIGAGGLSGAPLTAKALDTVRYIHKTTKGVFPIIGLGGIMSVKDAIAMFEAGASLVQVYTGFIYNGPCFIRRICRAVAKHRGLRRPQSR